MSFVKAIALVILSVLCLTTISQDFCDSYRKNGLKVIIINEDQFGSGLIIIDKHFWKVKPRNGKLDFGPLDRQAFNRSQQFLDSPHQPKGNYTFAFVATVDSIIVYKF